MKTGDKIKVTGNTNGNNYMIGEIYTIVQINIDKSVIAKKGNWQGNTIYPTDYVIVKLNIDEFKKEIKKLTENINTLKIKINYLEKTNQDTFNESDFMAWYLVELMNSEDKNKMKKISALLNTITNDINIDIIKNVN